VAKKKSSKKTRRKAGSDSFLTHGGVTLGISTLGLLVAFALVWWQAIVQPQQAAQLAEQTRLLNVYTQLFNSRVADLRATVNAMATAPATVEALLSFNPDEQAAAAAALAAQHPYVSRVDIIEKGKAEVDLSAQVPVSFAALDLIRRAETRQFVGPEAGAAQGNRLYAAQPITPDGSVAGVLLVVFEPEFLLDSLQHFTGLRGNLQILQTVAGTPTTAVLEVGSSEADLAPIEQELFIPHWKVAFAATESEVLQADNTAALFTPFALALALIMGGTFLGFSMYSRKVRDDAHTLTDYVTRIARGRSAPRGTYQLAAMAEIESAVAAHDKNPAAEASAEQQDDKQAGDDAEDLLEGLEKETPAASKKDFLDVQPSGAQDNFGIEVSEEVGPMDMGIDFDAGIFRAYDIRGITTTNLTEEVVYWIGRAFAAEALAKNQSRVAVGRDGRHSGEPLQASLTKGLTEGGIDVISIGRVPTPTLYYATYALDTGTGIMITGSHNPPEYNGLKMMIGGVTLAEDMIQALFRRLQNNDLSEGEGDVDEIDLDDSYIDKVLEEVALAQPLKVVVDCGNGVAGDIAPRLLRELGCEVIELYCEIDGDFPNHHPDPAEPENLEDLRTVVQAEKADLGLAFDGDGDRLGVVTNSGEIIWPDKLIMLFAQDIVSRNPGADIIYDVKCSRHLNNIISELGGRPIMWKTGHSHMKAKIKETGALLAGEFSGHICFGERWYGFDDALYSAVRLLEILSTDGRTVDEVFAQFPVTFTTPEIKITTTESEKFEIMEKLAAGADWGEGTITTIDGIRVDYADGWGLIRPSNTSPVLSLRFEADGPSALDRIQDEFQQQLTQIEPGLSFR
jgi:phosphomannomutase / phosphoglucomutase